ncbi:MAG TPA: uroporphyrinogen-III synthase [Saprospiraceae bacterium]|nr:uroporphyrinogen-III synthase [Saprospiraceae bacterium]
MKDNAIVYSTFEFGLDQQKILSKRNIEIRFLKMMDVHLKNEENILRKVNNISVPIVFTSQHAVKFIKQIESENQFTSKGKYCFAIEGSTQRSLSSSNLTLLDSAKDSQQLALKIIESKVKEVVHLTTSKRLDTLETILKSNDIDYKVVEVYYKKYNSIAVNDYDGLVFTSPGYVDCFFENNKPRINIPSFCIGKTTAGQLEKLGYNNIIVAKKASKESMVDTLINYFSKRIYANT